MIRRRSPLRRSPLRLTPKPRRAPGASSSSTLAIAKGPTRRQVKARRDRLEAAATKAVRVDVFKREGDLCRCCLELFNRIRRADSMHEIVPRSIVDPLTGQLGVASLENSIAVCGSGTTLCHGELQAHRYTCEKLTPEGAQGPLRFGVAA